jgi:hypothetical protein
MSASAWDPGLYSQITQEFSSQRNNIWLSLRALKVSLAGLQRIVIEISNRFSFFAPSADDYCKDVPITDISNWEQQGLSFKISNNLGQFGKQLPKGTQFIVAAYPLPTLGKINFQILSNSVADLLTRDMMNRYMQRLFDFCVPAVNCNPRPTQLNTPVVLGEPQMAANQELLVSIPVSNTALTEQKTYQLLQCLNIYRPITTFCLPDNSCRNVELIFASAILIDGLGDAIGAARTIKLISQLFPGATFRVVIADWYLGYNSFNIFQKNSWPLGYKKFMEMISKFGLNDRISAVVLDETNTEIICNSISESNNGLVISGPSGSFYMICDGNFENHLQILELDNSDISYGLKDNGMGMPLPSDDEIAFISTYNFQNPQLAQLFQQSSPKPLLVYMKDRARLVSFVKEARAFIGTASSLPVILLGYKAKSGEIPISAELCESLLIVAVTEYSTDGQSTVNTVSCSNVAVGRVNIYNFGDMVILHDDFMLAVSKSYDIVGVTGDQSFLEALALGKIPVRDNILHKYNFDKALRDYYVKIVGIDSTLIKFLDNVQNPAARQAISSDQLPLMKQHMQTIVGKMRSDLDPMPRVRQVIENKISTMPTDEI